MNLFEKYKGIILYVFFGVLTVIVNLISYYIFYEIIKISNVKSTIIAWVIAVIFAFITNKLYVFNSKSKDLRLLVYELSTFMACRIGTGLLEIIIMYVAVDIQQYNAMYAKGFSNIIVIILNYILSKLIVFNSKRGKSK